MGFFLMSLAFVLQRRRPRWAAFFLALGLSAGTLLGVARIVQGKHFPSDVIWSCGLVYFTGVALYYALGLHQSADRTQSQVTHELEASDEPVILPFRRPEQEARDEDDQAGKRTRERRPAKAA